MFLRSIHWVFIDALWPVQQNCQLIDLQCLVLICVTSELLIDWLRVSAAGSNLTRNLFHLITLKCKVVTFDN